MIVIKEYSVISESGRKKNMMTLRCPKCGRKFDRVAFEVMTKGKIFCSYRCELGHRKNDNWWQDAWDENRKMPEESASTCFPELVVF